MSISKGIPNTQEINKYLKDLRCCKEKAQRDDNQKGVELQAASDKYASSKALYDKLEGFWKMVVVTNDHSLKGQQAITSVKDTSTQMKKVVELDRKAMECLVKELEEFSAKLEAHKICLDCLLKTIENIKRTRLDHANSIIQTLQRLLNAYKEAIAAATKALGEALKMLELVNSLWYKINGTSSPSAGCKPLADVVNADACPDDPAEAPLDYPASMYVGLCAGLEELERRFETQFNLFTLQIKESSLPGPEDKTIEYDYTFKRVFVKKLHKAMKKAAQQVETDKAALDKKSDAKSKSKGKSDAARLASEAAEAAQKC